MSVWQQGTSYLGAGCPSDFDQRFQHEPSRQNLTEKTKIKLFFVRKSISFEKYLAEND